MQALDARMTAYSGGFQAAEQRAAHLERVNRELRSIVIGNLHNLREAASLLTETEQQCGRLTAALLELQADFMVLQEVRAHF